MSRPELQRGNLHLRRVLLRSLVVAGLLALALVGAAIAAALFADGFESGDLTAWSTSDDSGSTASLAVTAAAAIGPGGTACGGSPCGLAVTVSSGSDHAWVADQTPNAETVYYASFRIDPNAVDSGSFFSMPILTGDQFDSPPSDPTFIVSLSLLSGSYHLGISGQRDDGGFTGIPFQATLPDAPSFVEVLWAAASGPGISDGFLRLFVNGAFAAGVGLDNSTRRVEAVRLGAVRDGNSNDATGTYFLDDFSSFDDLPVDLSIQKTGIESPPGTVAFTLSVTNNGPAHATGVVVTDPLPAKLQYQSDDCGGNDVPPWTWEIGAMFGNGSSVTCQILLAVLEPGTVENTATVSADQRDDEGSNQSATATLLVTGSPAREIPTLAGAGMVLLGVLLAGAAFWSLRRGA